MERYETLYKLNAKGKILEWYLERDDYKYRTISGQKDGNKTISKWTESKPKNIGKKNETTATEQAIKEVLAKYKKKLNQGGYVLNKENAVRHTYIKPMLAETYYQKATEFYKEKNNIPTEEEFKEGIYIQPKLDGALQGNTKISTSKGLKTIKEIVDNKLKVDVLSFNEISNEFEYKPIVGFSNEKCSSYKEWKNIYIDKKFYLNCTFDHPLYTNNGWKQAAELNPDNDLLYARKSSIYLNGLILGTLLGDSCFSRQSDECFCLLFSHTNLDYFNFKKDILNIKGRSKDYISGYESKGKCFTSNSLSKLINYDIFYNKTTKKRNLYTCKYLYSNLTLEGISLWIADDGSLRFNNGNSKTPVLSISTHNHSEEQIEEFILFFNKKFNIHPTKIKDKRVQSTDGYYLNFNTKDTLYLLNFLRDKQCKGVEYKYYFPAEGYIKKATDSFEYVQFEIKNCTYRKGNIVNYDIAVLDNHNFVANDILVHNCRAIATKNGLYTREGKDIIGVPHIKKALSEFFKENESIILDGEIYKHNWDLNTIIGHVRREPKEDNEAQSFERKKLEYYIYDVVDETLNYKERRKLLQTFVSDLPNEVKILGSLGVVDQEQVEDEHNLYIQYGYEGAILRKGNSKYQKGKRTKDLLKVKLFEDNEFKILDILEGRGNNSGIAAKVMVEDNAIISYPNMVGSWEFCAEVLKEKEEYIGGTVTVKYFGKTPEGCLRFPNVTAIYKKERDL